MGIPSLDLSYPSGYFKGLCGCGFKNPYFSPCSFERSVSTYFTAYWLRWFRSDIWLTPNHGWLAVVSVWMLGYTSLAFRSPLQSQSC